MTDISEILNKATSSVETGTPVTFGGYIVKDDATNEILDSDGDFTKLSAYTDVFETGDQASDEIENIEENEGLIVVPFSITIAVGDTAILDQTGADVFGSAYNLVSN